MPKTKTMRLVLLLVVAISGAVAASGLVPEEVAAILKAVSGVEVGE